MPSSDTIKPPANGNNSAHIAFNLGAIALVLVLLGIGAAYLIDGMSAQNRSLPALKTAGPTIEKTLSGQKLLIPPAWFRFAEQRAPGFSEKIDLLFALPLGRNNKNVEIEVSLEPRSRARSSARLLDAVYLHQFLPEQVEGPPGLVGKPLKNADGFQNETVWYDPLSIEPFVAKCMAPVASGEQAKCMRTILIGDQISATYIFDMEVLAEWKRFDQEAERWLARIGGT